METDFKLKRILREIDLLKEAFPEKTISYNKLKIVVTDDNFKCIIKLPSNWPFHPPVVLINYQDYSYYQPQIKDWTPVMDLRTVFYDILNTIVNGKYINISKIENIKNKSKNDLMITSEHQALLKSKYIDIEIIHSEITNYPTIKLNGLEITISYDEITVIEDEKDWPKYMIPDHTDNIFDIINQIVYNKLQSNIDQDYISKCKISLIKYFDDIAYHDKHQTFIVNTSKYLIIIGVNINAQYLSPMIITYSKGSIIDTSFDVSNWEPDNLGINIINGINNYENSRI